MQKENEREYRDGAGLRTVRMNRRKQLGSEIYADGSSVVLTRAVGREACPPGRRGLVLIQLMCRCTQHHQQEKSAPQRHRPLSAADHATEQKKAPPARSAVHQNNAPEAHAEQIAGWNK